MHSHLLNCSICRSKELIPLDTDLAPETEDEEEEAGGGEEEEDIMLVEEEEESRLVRVSVWNVAREDQQEINSSSSLFASSSPLSLEVNEEYLEIPELVVSYPKSPTPVHAFSFSGKFWAVCTAVDCKEYLEIYSTASWKKIKVKKRKEGPKIQFPPSPFPSD
ncbi:wdr8 protein isoform 3 family protein [Cystoisospora suis]|uniref:Wdr8 protein isoform 3 family protein n=1 Tax=Cystoisospora suis TaxID=483139 RepID=A0A2C6KLZ4_9APIC|nr:wdr8 protein isoform 3 family protein [Cystoisospora suis]